MLRHPRRLRWIVTLTCVIAGVSSTAQQSPTPQDDEPPPIKRAVAPPPGPYAPGFDALHYDIAIELPASGAVIRGVTTIRVGLRAPRAPTLSLDFTGLAVDRVRVDGDVTTFTHDAGKLRVPIPPRLGVGDALDVEVAYHGHPDDGLIIQKNVHGELTVFADNWPDRGRFWFPSIDHPSDKATVSFTIAAPAEWTVIANGSLLGSAADPADANRKTWRWRTELPIPTYTMVIGAARFTTAPPVRSCSADRCVDVTWWAFPDDAGTLRRWVGRADAMLRYFADLIAPFEYEKLAHVESSTIFGGMENTSAIFYPEKPLAEGRTQEGIVAHETAHQWFGDSVSIREWSDVWLSEGFATYFEALFYAHADGAAAFRNKMATNRDEYLKSRAINRPVVDTAERDLLALLNKNSYEKGAWVLHMLRRLIGDRAFFDGLRAYYRQHRLGNATTADLRAALEQTSGRPLDWFFQQWLYAPGYPKLRPRWRWDARQREVIVSIEQTQPATWPTFRLPLTIAIDGTTTTRHAVDMTTRMEVYRFAAATQPTRVTIDPDESILKEIER